MTQKSTKQTDVIAASKRNVCWRQGADKDQDDEIMVLCDLVREVAYSVHQYLGPGHLEKVYENALVHRLRKEGCKVEQQHPLKVYDEDGTLIGEYFADLLVDGCLIVELKASKDIAEEHTAQLLGYLRSSRKRHGIIINFGSWKFQIKKYVC